VSGDKAPDILLDSTTEIVGDIVAGLPVAAGPARSSIVQQPKQTKESAK
jgi:hypothetical protein